MLLKIENMDQFNSPRTYLLIAFIVILIAGFLLLMIKAKKVETIQTKRIYQGYALFGLCYAFTRIFFLFSDYEIAKNLGVATTLHNTLVVAAYAVTFASLVFIFYVLEKHLLNRKLIFMSIAIITFIIDIIALILTMLEIDVFGIEANNIALYSQYIAAPILALAIFLLYITIMRNSTGDVKKRATKSFIGLFLIILGIVIDMDLMSALGIDQIRYILAPILFIVGALVFYTSQR